MNDSIWNFLQKLHQPQSFESKFAILILNQPILCEPQLIKSLWNKAVVRALVDGGTNRWQEFLRKFETSDMKLPNFCAGDFDSILPETRAYFEGLKVKMIPTPDQDETDFTKALRCVSDFLKENNLEITMVLAVCEFSNRFDHVIGNINTLHTSSQILGKIPVAILSSESIAWVVPPGDHTINLAENFVTEQFSCGLIPFCGSTVVTTNGLKWNLNEHTMEIGGLISTSNTFSSTQIKISCNKDLLFTTEYSKIQDKNKK